MTDKLIPKLTQDTYTREEVEALLQDAIANVVAKLDKKYAPNTPIPLSKEFVRAIFKDRK